MGDSLLRNKLCLVTGANSGIGRETAAGLAKSGARVVMLCRNPQKAEAARVQIAEKVPGAELDLLLCDLSSQKQVRRAAEQFAERFDRLDVLVNNAGLYCKRRETTEDGLEMTFAVNHLAPFLLTNLLLPILKRSAPARIVNVSALAHKWGRLDFDDLQCEEHYNGIRAYCTSKLCNILFTRELSRRLEGTGVTANALHPGVIATELGEGGLPRFLTWFRWVLPSAEKGARTSLYLAGSPEAEGVSGRYFSRCKEASISAAAADDAPARRLWEESEALARLSAGGAF